MKAHFFSICLALLTVGHTTAASYLENANMLCQLREQTKKHLQDLQEIKNPSVQNPMYQVDKATYATILQNLKKISARIDESLGEISSLSGITTVNIGLTAHPSARPWDPEYDSTPEGQLDVAIGLSRLTERECLIEAKNTILQIKTALQEPSEHQKAVYRLIQCWDLFENLEKTVSLITDSTPTRYSPTEKYTLPTSLF